MGIIDENFISKYTKEKLWNLPKEDILKIARAYEIDFKKSVSKQGLMELLEKKTNVNYIKIYNDYKNSAFGVSSKFIQELSSNIDHKVVKKMESRNWIKIAYKIETKLYGKYQKIPYYQLDSLLTISEDDISEFKAKYCKDPTEKQLDTLEKARKISERNRFLKSGMGIAASRCKYFLNNKEDFIILDVETTGLSDYDKIVSIGIINLNGDVLLDTLVYTDYPISSEASEINGITNFMLGGKPTIEKLNSKLNQIFKNKTILIFNDNFDVRMLYQSGFQGYLKSECLMELYMRYCNSDRWIGLQRAMEWEGIDIIQDHTASGDCQCCLELIKNMAARLDQY